MNFMSDVLPMLVLTLLLIFGFGGFIWYLEKKKQERKKKEVEFVGILLSAFNNSAIKDSSDLISFYESQFGVARQKIKMYSDIHLLLAQAQVKISSAAPNSAEQNLVSRIDELRQLGNSVNALLREEEKREPFYGTPDIERSLLEDILELTASDKDVVNAKLIRLAELIKARQDTIDVLGEEKGKARKLAYWGLAGSVVFGIASLILGVMQYVQAISGTP